MVARFPTLIYVITQRDNTPRRARPSDRSSYSCQFNAAESSMSYWGVTLGLVKTG